MDKNTFDTIYERYWLSIYTSTFKRLSNPQKASQITQEAFFQLWLNKDQLKGDDVILFLLKAAKKEVFKLMEKECIYIINPPRMILGEILLPGAN